MTLPFDKDFKPMLAAKADLMALQYPVAVTPKFDGIRVLIIDGVPVSRTLKPIRNKRINEILTGLPGLLDGEIIADSNSFQESTTAVMKATSEIPWTYYIFDYVDVNKPSISPYTARMSHLQSLQERGALPKECKLVLPGYI